MFKEVPYVNEFNQEIQPGETVLYMTTYSHHSDMHKGIYLGQLCDENGEWTSLKIRKFEKPRWGSIFTTLYLGRIYKFV